MQPRVSTSERVIKAAVHGPASLKAFGACYALCADCKPCTLRMACPDKHLDHKAAVPDKAAVLDKAVHLMR